MGGSVEMAGLNVVKGVAEGRAITKFWLYVMQSWLEYEADMFEALKQQQSTGTRGKYDTYI
jgi:hypothetical protein